MKQKLRQIIVDGTAYRWRFDPSYVHTPATSELYADTWHCRDTFTAYLATRRTGPLQIIFLTWEGGPLHTGAPISLGNPQSSRINLHTPAFAAQLIQYARRRGWNPEQTHSAFVIENGLDVLAELGYTVT